MLNGEEKQPPPYPGHQVPRQPSVDSLSCSGSETSYDISRLAADNLSIGSMQDLPIDNVMETCYTPYQTTPQREPHCLIGCNPVTNISEVEQQCVVDRSNYESFSSQTSSLYDLQSSYPSNSLIGQLLQHFTHYAPVSNSEPVASVQQPDTSPCLRGVRAQSAGYNRQKHVTNVYVNDGSDDRGRRPSTAPPQHHVLTESQTVVGSKPELHRSYEMLDRPMLTSSQPDLTRLRVGEQTELDSTTSCEAISSRSTQSRQPIQHSQTPSCSMKRNVLDMDHAAISTRATQMVERLDHAAIATRATQMVERLDHAAIATRATQMVERLSEENRALRLELNTYYKKVTCLEKMEHEIQKVGAQYEALAQHCQKRENLEKMMRSKLDLEISKLTEANRELKEQLERSIHQLQRKQCYNMMPESELLKELQKKDAIIARLLTQNRELCAAKERMEVKASTWRTTESELKTRIDMLENGLAKAQASASRLEAELEKRKAEKQGLADIENALAQLQVSAERRDAIERRLCARLEDDAQLLRNQQCDTDDGISSDSESPTSVHSLIRQMQEKERCILLLEAEVAKWEQKFHEESVFRQLAVDAISVPKDAKIAILEQSCVNTDKMMAAARSEKLTQLRELYQANSRCAELESRLKMLKAELAEKEALIRVFHQHHSSLSHASSISSLLAASSPLHSPNMSFIMASSNTPSTSSSRQSSQLDPFNEHRNKDSERGSGSNSACMSESQFVQQQMVAQAAAMFGSAQSLGSGTDQIQQRFWQV